MLSESEFITCPLCGSREILLFLASERQSPKDKVFRVTTNSFGDFTDIWRCNSCGFVFQDLTKSEFEQAYASVVDERYLDEECGRRKTARRILETIEGFVVPGYICDVGCFTGLLLAVARNRGWRVCGIEPSHWATSVARERYSLNVIEGTLAETEAPNELFEVVTLIDVIEHLSQPTMALTKVNQLLKNDGFVYISTPDVSSVAARLLGCRWWGYRLEHVSYFNGRTLQWALRQAGFETLCIWRRGRDFSLLYWISKLIDLSSPTGRRISRFLSRLSADHRMIYLNLGDQIDVLARKRVCVS